MKKEIVSRSLIAITSVVIMTTIFNPINIGTHKEEQQEIPTKSEIIVIEDITDDIEEEDVFELLIEEEPIVEEEVVSLIFDTYELELLAMVTYAEAGNQCDLGKRLVIDTILNRVDHENYPDSITEVIQGQNQYTPVWEDTSGRYYVDDDIYQLVLEELESRTDTEVLFFRADHFHDFGTPMFQVEDHYFSKY